MERIFNPSSVRVTSLRHNLFAQRTGSSDFLVFALRVEFGDKEFDWSLTGDGAEVFSVLDNWGPPETEAVFELGSGGRGT